MDDLEIIKEFLIESNENLSRLDREIVELETDPENQGLVASIFRTVHTIKGTCGFFGFEKLTAITHNVENILSQVRDGKRPATPKLINVILEAIDGVKEILRHVEAAGSEGGSSFVELTKRLEIFAASETGPEDIAAVVTIETSEKTEAAKGAAADSTIRVDVGLLDKLMNLVGELVLARNQVLQSTICQRDGAFHATSQRLNLITSELQASVMKTRMQPIGSIWGKFPRVVRDLANGCGKKIHLTLEGADTELDRTIIEAIKDPLTHILRNSCDHGIERIETRVKNGKPAVGRLSLRAFHEDGRVNIEVSDDGAGIHPEKITAKAIQRGLISADQAARMSGRDAIHLIFAPGFSTAETVSNISGRGVGMDVVKTNIERIGGVVDLVSHPGRGTAVKLKIPLTLAIIPGLVVTSGRECFVIPQASLLELIRLEGEMGLKQIERIQGTPVYRRRGKLLPLSFLNEIFEMPASPSPDEVINIVVLQAEDREFGLVVDFINDTQEIVVKPLSKYLKGLNLYSGATIMGDGKIALILDVLGIAQRSGVMGESANALSDVQHGQSPPVPQNRENLLLFRAGRFERLAVPLNLVARLEEIPRDQIEHAAARMVVQYRGQILPLVPLASQLGSMTADALPPGETVPVVVFGRGERLIGVIVDRILDIVEEQVSMHKSSETPGLLGSAVVGQKVTDFIDLHEIIARSGEDWAGASGTSARGLTVLIAEASAFARTHLRSSLEMAGYRIVEAAGFQEAVEKLAHERVRIVVASTEIAGLAEYIKNNVEFAHIPILGMTPDLLQTERTGKPDYLFEELPMKFDRKAMLSSLRRLSTAIEDSTRELAVVGNHRP